MKSARQLMGELSVRLEKQRKDEVAEYWLNKIRTDLSNDDQPSGLQSSDQPAKIQLSDL